jgi:hypothetical protein
VARALDPPVPEEAAGKVTPLLERLESALEPHVIDIPLDGLPWTAVVEGGAGSRP